MRDQFVVTLEDHELLGEVETLTSVMIAGTASVGPMSMDAIDSIVEAVRLTVHGEGATTSDPVTPRSFSSVGGSRHQQV